MPVVFYPPSLPLHERMVFHRQDLEGLWAAPLPFIPFLMLATVIFLAGLWAVSQATSWHVFASMDAHTALLIVSLIPPLVLVALILITPHLSSPTWPYQLQLIQDQLNPQLHWNLAVVATAHIYCGRTAQVEWINQIPHMLTEDRQLALGYIKRVRSRLQQIPILTARDWLLALAACVATLVVSLIFLHAPLFEAIFHSFALVIMVQLFMLYLYTQRWQHIRRLMELEEVFEELMPARTPIARESLEDEVADWQKEREEAHWRPLTPSLPPSMMDAPPVPWEK
jgi:hypothetical protein